MCVQGNNNSKNEVDEKSVIDVHEDLVFHAGNSEEEDGAEPFNDMVQSHKEKSRVVNTFGLFGIICDFEFLASCVDVSS